MRPCFIPFYADARELCKIQRPVAMYLRTKLSANREETYLRICKPVELQRQIESSYCARLDNRVEAVITASLIFDRNYLDFRQFYVIWAKDITWCFPGDFEIIDRRQRLFRSTFYNCESRILSMVYIFKALFCLLTVNSYYYLAAAQHLKSSWLPVTLR